MHNSSGSGGFFKRNAIPLIMAALLMIIGLLLFSDFSKSPIVSSDTIDPYVLSTKGKTLIFRDRLITVEEQKEEHILIGDKIKTLDSTATIFWPDGSITRLSERSSIIIHEMRAKTASEHIQIDFSLEQGKSWSNVVRYLFDDSYFHERFNDDTTLAAVRGTVFEVNLDKKYIHTIDHGVSIESAQGHTGSVLLVAGGVLDTDTRKALIQSQIDTAWNAANTNEDIIYLNSRLETLKKELATFGKSGYLSEIRTKFTGKEDVLMAALMGGDSAAWTKLQNEIGEGANAETNLMNLYQKFYALPNTENTLDTKMRLRDLMIESAPEEKKKDLLTDFARSTLYDIWKEGSDTGNKNMEKLEKKFHDYMKDGADAPTIEGLMNGVSGDGIMKLNGIIKNIVDEFIGTLGKRNIMDEVANKIPLKEINDQATKLSNSWLENTWNTLTK